MYKYTNKKYYLENNNEPQPGECQELKKLILVLYGGSMR
jgi:hypothetical protein